MIPKTKLRKNLPYVLIGLNLLFTAQVHAEIDDRRVIADCKKIPSYANAGNTAYQKGDYVTAQKHFMNQVAWTEACHFSDEVKVDSGARATAYNNMALTYIRQGDLLKAKAWLMIAPEDKKSQYNLKLIADKIAALPKPTTYAGEYWQYSGLGNWNSIEVTPKGNKFTIDYNGYYFGIMGIYYGPNMGQFSFVSSIPADGKVEYDQSKADKETDYSGDCKVNMQFTHADVTVETAGDCGFGHNVSADGNYIRVR
ncbi:MULTISPECIES: tetratricopeptide repeat protein [Yersinia]|nr:MULTISPECIES: tetratricopeptide repeat protein [Yersinia]OWF89131.1 hypothetical protein B4914_04395 [Yersinia entomophaga]